MKKVLYIFRQKSLENVIGNEKNSPTDFLFGINHISKDDFDVTCINAPRGERKGIISKLCYLIEKPFSFITKIGLPIEIFHLFKKEIKNNDILICVNDPISMGILFWKKLGFIKADCVVIIQSLPERIKYFHRFPPIIWLISSLLKEAKTIMTLSEYVHKDFTRDFKLDRNKLKTFHFGVDTNFWSPSENTHSKDFILSIGNDMNRDYRTLIEALPENTNLTIITNRKIKSNSKNVRILTGLSDKEVRDLYRKSLFVVIPIIRLKNESSGLSSSLQATACGKPIIISKIPTLEEVFDDQKHCLFYEPENSKDLNKKITTLLGDKSLRKKISADNLENIKKFTTEKMAEQITTIISAK